jgi:hypothetical protein
MSKTGSPLEALKGGFRRACVKRLVGDENGAIEVLKDEIPLLVVAWAKTSSLEPGEKKAKLKEMFDDESARAEELAVAFDLFAARFEARVANRVHSEVLLVSQKLDSLTTRLESAINALSNIQPTVLPEESKKENKPSIIEHLDVDVPDVEDDTDRSLDEVINELDPPVGSGLKFDEIEAMIDELLVTDD